MLLIPLKVPVPCDLQLLLSRWLDSDDEVSIQPKNSLEFAIPKPDYDSQACADELGLLGALRRNICDNVLLKPDSHRASLKEKGLDELMEYHAVLLAFESKGFPAVVDDAANGVKLSWKGAFLTRETETHHILIWERVCTLYNIAALLTAQAADCSSTDRQECKEAVQHCQTAVRILQTVKKLTNSSIACSTVDLSPPMLHFWETFLLAHAQTNIYHMAALAKDDSKHSTLALLSQSAFLLYNQVLSTAQNPRIESEVPELAHEWALYAKTQAMLASAKAEYHQSVVQRLEHQHGKEIARLRDSLKKVDAALDFIQGTSMQHTTLAAAHRECLAIRPAIHDRLQQADKDNYTNYHYEIPQHMPAITGKQLAKAAVTLPESMRVPRRPLFAFVQTSA